MLKAVIFDFDGTIIDTETPEYQIWADMYAEYGQVLPIDLWVKYIGTAWNSFHPAEYLQERCQVKIDVDRIKSVAREKFLDVLSRAPLRPGVGELIDELVKELIPIAVASSSPYYWVKRHLERSGMLEKFSYISTADDVKMVKPAPDIYLTLLQKMNLLSTQTVTFEDSANGIKAAKSADIFCIAIPNDITKYLDLSGANIIISSVNDITIAELKKLI